MPFNNKSWWQIICVKVIAAWDIEDSPTFVAAEMVMVFLIGQFEPTWFPRQINGMKPTVFVETFDVSVDGRDPQTGHIIGGPVEDFICGERAPGMSKDGPNGIALICFTTHREP